MYHYSPPNKTYNDTGGDGWRKWYGRDHRVWPAREMEKACDYFSYKTLSRPLTSPREVYTSVRWGRSSRQESAVVQTRRIVSNGRHIPPQKDFSVQYMSDSMTNGQIEEATGIAKSLRGEGTSPPRCRAPPMLHAVYLYLLQGRAINIGFPVVVGENEPSRRTLAPFTARPLSSRTRRTKRTEESSKYAVMRSGEDDGSTDARRSDTPDMTMATSGRAGDIIAGLECRWASTRPGYQRGWLEGGYVRGPESSGQSLGLGGKSDMGANDMPTAFLSASRSEARHGIAVGGALRGWLAVANIPHDSRDVHTATARLSWYAMKHPECCQTSARESKLPADGECCASRSEQGANDPRRLLKSENAIRAVQATRGGHEISRAPGVAKKIRARTTGKERKGVGRE
ncbi:predicted protein [Postia placenta Mad-698-R]|uniref:Uncharacterized protein n=1 Tax=Postia placenta MAD-698-R-SB12 TaxID=670580 RepID=A0A1X6N6Q0_9APHY|nr:hypothetical protein POSPLADRAFT_1138488 [Postia placenta MAD-698-R-SB12]EED81866.1 predicted protein [Postia placenta Mad-698-R]OSX64073.1 hypothetical protein POSPLADRAFT_1138488 [Postia placenta MAD-698-R-SB12]